MKLGGEYTKLLDTSYVKVWPLETELVGYVVAAQGSMILTENVDHVFDLVRATL